MNILQWQKLDCIHKDVCFHNGIKCGEFVCRDIKPQAKERTCTSVAEDEYWFECSECGASLNWNDCMWGCIIGGFCFGCGAKVMK